MNEELKNFFETKSRSQARILDGKRVEVIAPDGEAFELLTQIGMYGEAQTRQYYLHLLEQIFDRHYSVDKEEMSGAIWREFYSWGIIVYGMSSGNRQSERLRIGERIKQLREEKGVEAQEVARLAKIDPANLSRIERGKQSVGIDILSKIAFVLGAHVDLVSSTH